jgi:hypothetical protein
MDISGASMAADKEWHFTTVVVMQLKKPLGNM